jgi:hypothetical protein
MIYHGGLQLQVCRCPNHLAHFFATVSSTLFLHVRIGDFFFVQGKIPLILSCVCNGTVCGTYGTKVAEFCDFYVSGLSC